MVAQLTTSIENNFTKGLITESTGLNFPENAATSTDNCIYTIVGDVTRRNGVDFESNFSFFSTAHTNTAINTYKWNNAGGDGTSQIVVSQVGSNLLFYLSSAATATHPLSNQLLSGIVNISLFTVPGVIFDATRECQFADGNGFLFVFHPSCDPIYCTYDPTAIGGIGAAAIDVQIRDFIGLIDNLSPTTRPPGASDEHNYNIKNQGWVSKDTWYTNSSSPNVPSITTLAFTVGVVVGVSVGQQVFIHGFGGLYHVYMSGVVTGYSGGVMNVAVYAFSGNNPPAGILSNWSLASVATTQTAAFLSSQSVYPSNGDVWWYFKDTTGVFNPTTTVNNVTIPQSNAPRGHYTLNAFDINRAAFGSVNILAPTHVQTLARPTTGAWFQGRVWYSGVNASQPAKDNYAYYSWTSNIYFSQIVQSSADLGNCYQVNDPTSETLFDLLPTDGGVITIPQAGIIYKLFPIQNGMLVFAANGVWFITGSKGIGFSADDYTIIQLSEVKSISGSSYVNVLGLPYFWNEEGIYAVVANQTGSLVVTPITVGTILSFYNQIPVSSRRYARGTYDPIEYAITWIFKSTVETDITSRYQFDRALNFNTYNKAFFPYTINGIPNVCGINYVANPNNTAPDPIVKYYTNCSSGFTFAEENDDTHFLDFFSFDSIGEDYTSFFITGYKIKGQAIRKFQPQYINIYSRMNGVANSYKFQGIWDFANQINSNRWSTVQVVNNIDTRYDTVPRRHKIRGHGYTLQFKIASVTGQPFDIQGWAVTDVVNAGT